MKKMPMGKPKGRTKNTKCSVPGCDRDFHARGLCQMHYQRKRNTGTTDLPDRYKQKSKGDEGEYARGMTRNEYARFLRHGSTEYKRKPPTV